MSHDELIARAEASLEGVTTGPWSAYIGRSAIQVGIGASPNGTRPNIVDWPGFDSCDLPLAIQRSNANFIAASRQNVPDLIAALRAEKRARALDAEKLATLERINLDLLGNLRAAEASAELAEAMAQQAEDKALERAIAFFEPDEFDGDTTRAMCEYAQRELRSFMKGGAK